MAYRIPSIGPSVSDLNTIGKETPLATAASCFWYLHVHVQDVLFLSSSSTLAHFVFGALFFYSSVTVLNQRLKWSMFLSFIFALLLRLSSPSSPSFFSPPLHFIFVAFLLSPSRFPFSVFCFHYCFSGIYWEEYRRGLYPAVDVVRLLMIVSEGCDSFLLPKRTPVVFP